MERHVYTLLRFLHNQGIDTTVVTGTKEKVPEIDEKYNIMRVFDFRRRRWSIELPYEQITNSNHVRKIINKIGSNYDVVHTHGPSQLKSSEIDSSFKVVSTKHGIGGVCIGFWGIDQWCEEKPGAIKCSLCLAKIRPQYIPLLPLLGVYTSYFYYNVKKNYKRIDLNIAVSKYVYDVIYNTLKIDNMKVIYNFIDLENDIKYYEEKVDPVIDDKKITLIFSGRLDKQKGMHLLLQSFAELNDKYDNLKLIITGNGALRNMVETYDKKYENINYEGFVSRLKQIELISSSDVFLAPSIYPDACPTSIMEALALGKPVIGTYAGGIPEISEDNIHGYLSKPGDKDDLIDKLEKIINEDRSRYKDKCIRKAEFFDIQNIGPQIIKEYEEML